MRALVSLLLLAGCAPDPSAAHLETAEVEAPEDEAPNALTYGEPPDGSITLTDLSDIIASPEEFADTVVRTEGEIAQVCQRAGCWMELRRGENGPAVRVPMAGHSFFLPRDSAGHHATMQGRVILSQLTDDVRAHLEAEGASETASALAIHATGVVID